MDWRDLVLVRRESAALAWLLSDIVEMWLLDRPPLSGPSFKENPKMSDASN